MMSAEKEVIPFSAPLQAKGNVEHWLLDVERAMRTTLYDVHKQALRRCAVLHPVSRSEPQD
jgi:hypothetical protein